MSVTMLNASRSRLSLDHSDDEEVLSDDPEHDFYYQNSHYGLTPVVHSDFSQIRDLDGNERRHHTWWQKFFCPEGNDGLFLPHQNIIWIWHVFSSVCIVVSCFIQAIAMSFQVSDLWVIVLLYVSDVLYIVEIIINFNLAYINKRGMLIADRRAVGKRYLKAQFIPDVITLIPLEIFGLTNLKHKDMLTFTMQLRGNRLFRYYKPIMNISKREAELGHNALLDRCAKYFLICAMGTHLMACLWFQFACNMFVTPPICYNQSWALADKTGISANSTVWDAYVISLYWAVATATSTGYGDISAEYMWEKFYSIIAMMAGIGIYFGMLLGGLTSMLTNLDQNRARYVHRFNVVQDEVTQTDCDDDLREQVIGYYEYIWVRKKAQASFEDLYKHLPFTIRGELSMAAYQIILDKAHLFDGCPKGFMRMLCMCIKPKLFLPHQIVVTRGDVGHEMYYIHSGEVDVLSEHDDDTPIATLKKGKMFGEISLMLSVPRTVTIRAATHCDLMVLERHDLQAVFHQYPLVLKHLQDVAKNRCKIADEIVSKRDRNILEAHYDAFKRRSSAFVSSPAFKSRRKSFSPSISAGPRPKQLAIKLQSGGGGELAGEVSTHSIAIMAPRETLRRRQSNKTSFLGKGSIFEPTSNFRVKQVRTSISMDNGYDIVQNRNMPALMHARMEESAEVCARACAVLLEMLRKVGSVTIPPDSALLKLWKLIINIVTFIMATLYPYQAVFAPYEDTLNNSNSDLAISVVVLTYVGNFLFLMDIIINLRTGIATPHGILSNFKDITHHYCRTFRFGFDVVSVLPLEAVRLFIQGIKKSTFFAFLHFNHIIKVFEIPMWFNQLEDSIDVNVFNTRSIKCVVYTLLATHWTACVMFYNACPGYAKACYPDSWYNQAKHLWPENHTNDYVISIYYAASTMTSTGYGEIHAHVNSDRLISLSAMLVGLLLYGYALSVIAATITNLDSFRVAYQERLFAVKQFFKERDVAKYLQEQVFNQMAMLWERYRGEWMPSKRKLMYDIPMALQQDIVMEDMDTIIRNTPIFRDLDDSFLRVACSKIDPYMFSPGDVIVYAGVLCREMCFVRRGLCQIISPDAVILAEIGPGQYFGVIAMLFGQYQKASLIAKTHVEILQLKLQDFNDSLSDYPLLAEQMKKLKRNMDGVKKAQNQMMTEMEQEVAEIIAKGKPPKVATKYANCGIEFKKGKPKNMKLFKTTLEDGSPNEDYLEPFTKVNKLVYILFRVFLMRRTFIPQSTVATIWAWFLFTLSLVISVTIPLQMSFLQNSVTLWVFHIFVDIVSLINIYISFHMAYLTQDGVLITHPLPCAKNYLKSNFVLDLLSVMPFELLWLATHWEEDIDTHVLALIRISRVLMCYRIPFVFSHFESKIQRATGIIRAIKFLIFMIIFENALTCIMFFETCLPHRFHETEDFNDKTFDVIGEHWCLPQSWLGKALKAKRLDEYRNSNLALYCTSFYWATATTLSVGYGDIHARSMEEMVVASTAMILGIFLFGYIVASVASSLANADTQRSQYQEKMLAIENYMKYQGVPKPLQNRVYQHYEHVWARTRGMDPKNLLDGMPLSLWGDVSLNLYKDILSKISWFQNVGDNFIMALSKCLKPMLILKGENIYQKDDVGNDVYFIHRGIVDVFTETSMISVRMDVLHEGQSFGEDAWLFNKPRPVTLMARVNCDLFVLSKNDLDSVLECYPTISQRIRKAAVEAHSMAKRHSINAKSFVPQMQMLNVHDEPTNTASSRHSRANRSYVPPSDRMFMPTKSSKYSTAGGRRVSRGGDDRLERRDSVHSSSLSSMQSTESGNLVRRHVTTTLTTSLESIGSQRQRHADNYDRIEENASNPESFYSTGSIQSDSGKNPNDIAPSSLKRKQYTQMDSSQIKEEEESHHDKRPSEHERSHSIASHHVEPSMSVDDKMRRHTVSHPTHHSPNHLPSLDKKWSQDQTVGGKQVTATNHPPSPSSASPQHHPAPKPSPPPPAPKPSPPPARRSSTKKTKKEENKTQNARPDEFEMSENKNKNAETDEGGSDSDGISIPENKTLSDEEIEKFLEATQYGWWRGLVYEEEKYRLEKLNNFIEKVERQKSESSRSDSSDSPTNVTQNNNPQKNCEDGNHEKSVASESAANVNQSSWSKESDSKDEEKNADANAVGGLQGNRDADETTPFLEKTETAKANQSNSKKKYKELHVDDSSTKLMNEICPMSIHETSPLLEDSDKSTKSNANQSNADDKPTSGKRRKSFKHGTTVMPALPKITGHDQSVHSFSKLPLMGTLALDAPESDPSYNQFDPLSGSQFSIVATADLVRRKQELPADVRPVSGGTSTNHPPRNKSKVTLHDKGPSSISHHSSRLSHHPSGLSHHPSGLSHHPSGLSHHSSRLSHHLSASEHHHPSLNEHAKIHKKPERPGTAGIGHTSKAAQSHEPKMIHHEINASRDKVFEEEESASVQGTSYTSQSRSGDYTGSSSFVSSARTRMSSLISSGVISWPSQSTHAVAPPKESRCPSRCCSCPKWCCRKKQYKPVKRRKFSCARVFRNLQRKIVGCNRLIIKYDDRRLLIFKDIMCFLNFFSILLIIFQASFHDGHTVLMVMSYVIDAMMLVDIYVKFRVTFVNQNGQVIQNFNVLFKKYLRSKTGLVIDLVAALPVEVFAVFAGEHKLTVLLYFRLWHMLRLIRLLEYFRKWEKELNINVLFVRSCKFFVLFTLITHTLSCLWYMISCPFTTCSEGSWVTFTKIFEEGELYTTTVYWTIATMTSTGYGDVAAHTVVEMMYASFVMVVGKLMFGFILANIASTLSNAGVYRVQYDLQIQSVRSHMADQGVPDFLHNRVVNYFNYLWMRNKGKNQHHLLSDCPTCLRAEVYLSITRPMLETIELFESVSESFLRRISQHVVPVFFMPGDYIVKSGDIGKHVYYIHRGEVDVICESTHHIMAVLKKGDVFGEVSLVGNLPRRITVRAVTHVDIYSLSKKSLDRVLNHYPEMRRLLGFRANERFGKLFEHCGIKLDLKV